MHISPGANDSAFSLFSRTCQNRQGGQRQSAYQRDHLKTPIEPGRIQSGGFFGPTNYSAVFVENSDNIGNDIQLSNDSDTLPLYDSLQAQNFLMLPSNEFRGSPRIALGVRILRHLPDEKTCNFLIQRNLDISCHAIRLGEVIMTMSRSLWSMWGKELEEPRNTEDLERISAHLCKNSETHFQEAEDYEPWIAATTGTNLRWEAVGLVFSAIAFSVVSYSDRDAFFTTQSGPRRDRRHFALELKDCVQSCVTLSNYMDYINMLMVTLLLENLILTTILSGDASVLVWRQLGDLVSMSTALGLHRLSDDDGHVTFLSQIKKRLFVLVFHMDKGASHLTGRPPALSYRYTRFRVPLDIDDMVLIQGKEAIEKAVQNLDSRGWNQEGRITSSTIPRARAMLCIISDEVLEISLGDPNDLKSDRILSLLDRLQETYLSLPSVVRFSPSDAYSHNTADWVLWYRLIVHLSFLEQRLTLERLAHKIQILNGQSMIDCALEMLKLTNLIWVQRDRFAGHHHDYDWMLMCWGVPSSGVLCVEVLKQMKSPSASEGLKIPKSEIVQNLSLLIGFLEWIIPGAGNYALCKRMSQLVKKILDQILNHSPGSSQQDSESRTLGFEENGFAGVDDNGMVGVDMNGLDGDVGGFGNLDWLNELDWSRGPWMNLDGLT
ncbi:fungal specific transcription factor protein [Rutstroemia sp. NJR-2017a WRK4]|nr:fungal specific transcription factor protein [Rutstroemia sp. NJR-2017a WRK4]